MAYQHSITVRLSPSEKEALLRNCSEAGMSLSIYIRTVLADAVITPDATRQQVTAALCTLTAKLQAQGLLENEALEKEVNNLWQALS